MNSDFFMTLPSNAKFDGNTTANFKVRLPQSIVLDGQWEVALVEIMYPHSWYNVTGNELLSSGALDTDMHPNSFYIWIHEHIWVHCLVAPNNYGDVKQLLKAMDLALQQAVVSQKNHIENDGRHANYLSGEIKKIQVQIQAEKSLFHTAIDELSEPAGAPKKRKPTENPNNADIMERTRIFEQERDALQKKLGIKLDELKEWQHKMKYLQVNDIVQIVGNSVRCQYDNNRQRVRIEMDTNYVTEMKLGPSLAYLLGYNDGTEPFTFNTKFNQAKYEPDLNAGFYALYVYCTVAENQIVADRRVPLLRTVHVEGRHGDICEKIFPTPHYVPVVSKEFDTIEIDIKNDVNQSVKFAFGKTVVKLHFRKKRTNYYF